MDDVSIHRKTLKIQELEKRLMLDASLGALATTTVFAENTVNAAPVILDADVTVTGSTTDFDGTALTISHGGGAQDQLSINNEGTGAGQIGFDGTNVSYEGTVIGTVSSDGANGADLVINFDADASKAAIERLIENVTYANNSDNPATSRTLNFALGVLFSENMDVVIVPDNEAPSVDTNAGLTLDEGANAIITTAELGVSDPDDLATDVVFTITNNVDNGRLELTTNAGVAINSFTLEQLNNNQVRYVHDDSQTTSDQFQFTITDGEDTTATQTFDITVNAIDDPLSLDTNTGTQVVAGDEVQIGGTDVPANFGTEILRQSALGQFGTFENLIDSGSSQMRLVFTTGASQSTGYPGEVLFETGGSGRGIGLYINDQNELVFYAGPAQTVPRLVAPSALATSTQYAVVMEIDQTSNQIRMHYQQAGDFNWFNFGRTAEATLSGWTGDNSGGNQSGLGSVGGNSYGGFNGSASGQTVFQGTIDSDFVVTRFPAGQTILENTKLVTSDPDTTAANIIYTITTDATDGELYNNGVLLAAGDTFTQEDLDNGLITYTHGGGSTAPDSFIFSVSDSTTTISNQTYDITVVNDPPSIDTNAGTDVFVGEDAQIGADEPDQFGTEVNRWSGVGEHPNIQAIVDGQDTQLSLVFTTPASTPNAVPGEVLFESGGAGRGIGLYLDDQGRLAWYAGPAQAAPILTSGGALNASTQYAVVIEIDSTNDQIRMHYQQAGNFNWFSFGRTAEATLNGFTETDLDGGDNAGLGTQRGSSYGGFNGTVSGTTDFQGTTDSDMVMTRFPANALQTNTKLVTADPDTSTDNIIYTITTDAVDGELYNNGVLLSVNDTFTQEDLDHGRITYTHGGALDTTDSFIFDVTDGTTTITGQTYDIRVDISNDAPVLDTTTVLNVNETANNGTSVATIEATDADPGQVITYSITGGTGAGIFTIDADTGEVTVQNNATLDYETTTSYTLTIRATDDFGVPEFDEHTFTVNVVDINEAPAIAPAGPFSVAEDATVGTSVGTVSATDQEGHNITYTINNGNADGIFQIDGTTGEITIANTTNLNFERDNSYTLQIRARDNGPGNAQSFRNVTINITDANEAATFNVEEVIENQNANVVYNSTTGNFYRFYDNNVNFATATANASAVTINGVSGHLVTITSAAENTFVDNMIGGSAIWLGGSDAANEGEWLWVTGEEAGTQFSQDAASVNGMYTRWQGGQPNNWSGTQHYMEMRTDGQWSDISATDNRRYVVEWDGAALINNNTYVVSHTDTDAADVNNGDSIGFVRAYDYEGDAITFAITGGNAGGVFGIDANTGEITIADDTNLDASVLDTYNLTITATEAGGGLTTDLNITVNFDKLFNLDQNNGTTVNENSNVIITNTDLQVSDDDTAASNIVYTVTTETANGRLELTTNPGVKATSFTQDDIDNNRLRYVHDGSETLSDSFDFSITDGADTESGLTFNITVDPVNQGPSIDTNTGTNVDEGGSRTITTAMLSGSDSDDADTDITYTASNLTNGHIEVNGVTLNTFTQAQLAANQVVFVHDGAEGDGSFDISLADGGEDGATADTATFTLTRNPLNDGPQITTNTGATVDEGGQVTITTADLDTTDPDDSGAGLTYTLSNITNGFVVLSTAPAVPVLSFTQADLDAGRVIFRHGGGENNGSFAISVADGGEDGATADTATFTVTRNPVNDAPGILVNAGSSINQNSILILKNSVLNANDPDDSGVGLTYTVDATSNGQVEFFSNPGVAITSFTQDDINNSRVVFRHDGSDPALGASFDFTLADGGEDGAGTVSDTFTFTVDNTNDAPSITTNSAPTFDEGSTNVITTAILDSFDADDFGADLTWTVSNLVNGIVQVNGVTQNTFTQADLDNGLVTFVHDGSETITAGFDMQIADGGEDGAAPDTGTFTINITPVNEAPSLILTAGSPTEIDFNDYSIDGYWGGQDGAGGATVSADGSTLTLNGNNWKKIDFGYTLTANTVIALDFRSDLTGEVQGLGFDTDTDGNSLSGFQFFGTQLWGNVSQNFANYDLGDGWVRYEIDIGSYFTGAQNHLVFFNDKDAGPGSTAEFRNVTIYEDVDVMRVTEGGTLAITTANLDSSDVDDTGVGLTYSLTNVTGGQVELTSNPNVAINSFTQADLDNGLVIFRHDGSEGIMAGFDVELADGGEDGVGTESGRFDIVVDPVDDAPSAATNNGITVNEGSTTTISVAELTTTDVDTPPSETVFNVTAAPGNGHLALSSNTGAAITSFTLNDLINDRVVYVHDGSETIADAFTFTISDGNTTIAADTFNITVNPRNDGAQITTNNGATVAEGNNVTITSAMLDMTDPDDNAAAVTYTASNITNGHIEVNGSTATTFTQDDIDNNRVVFVHDGSETLTASFDISLADGLEHGASADTATFNLTVTPVNDAPVVSDSSITVNEGGSQTIDLTALINDPENAIDPAAHIQILGTTLSSENVGNPLTGAGGADGWNSILIVDEARTYTNTTGAPVTINPTGFNFNAGSNGAPVTPFIVRVNGDNDFTVLAVGDSVTGFATGDVNAGFSAGDSSFVLQPGETIAMGFLDANADGSGSDDAVVRYTNGGNEIWLTGGASAANSGNVDLGHSTADMQGGSTMNLNRVYQFNIDFDVTTPANVGNVTYNAATGIATYTHDGSETTSDTFFFAVDDGTGPIIKAVDVTINPVNDIPTLPANTGVTLAEGGAVTLDNTMLAASDSETADGALVYTITALPAGVLENTNTASVLGLGDSFTQDDIDNGFISYTHDGEESTSETLSLTIGDGTDTITADFIFTITPVNDDPTAIEMTGGEVEENSALGIVVADLTTLDVDLPGDVITYSIVNDVDGMFTIQGSQIIVADAIDFETVQSMDIMIRADDNNGGTIDQLFTIEITDVDENTGNLYIPERDDRRPGDRTLGLAGFIGGPVDDGFFRGFVVDLEDRIGPQIVRENTTQIMRAMMDGDLPPALGSAIGSDGQDGLAVASGIRSVSPDAPLLPEQQEPALSTVRQALEFLQSRADGEELQPQDAGAIVNNKAQGDSSADYARDIEDQFRDVMTYHEMKQEKLRQALADSA